MESLEVVCGEDTVTRRNSDGEEEKVFRLMTSLLIDLWRFENSTGFTDRNLRLLKL